MKLLFLIIMNQDQNIKSFTTLASEPIFDSLGNQLHITSSLIGACSVLGHKGFGSGVTTLFLLHNRNEKPGNVIDANEDKSCNLIQNPTNPATSYCLTTGNLYRSDLDTSRLKN